jgi:hypothetical protein
MFIFVDLVLRMEISPPSPTQPSCCLLIWSKASPQLRRKFRHLLRKCRDTFLHFHQAIRIGPLHFRDELGKAVLLYCIEHRAQDMNDHARRHVCIKLDADPAGLSRGCFWDRLIWLNYLEI